MRDIVWDLVPLHLTREVFGRVMRERELWLAAIAGGATPEETAMRFSLDLKVVETVVAHDLAERGEK